MADLLVIFHSQQYGNTEQMAQAVAKGARSKGVSVKTINTNETRVDIELLRESACVAVGTPDYYSYIAGGLKVFFDDWHIAKGNDPEGLEDIPTALFYSHGGGGRVKGPLEELGSKLGPVIGETVESRGKPDQETLTTCERLGEELAEEM